MTLLPTFVTGTRLDWFIPAAGLVSVSVAGLPLLWLRVAGVWSWLTALRTVVGVVARLAAFEAFDLLLRATGISTAPVLRSRSPITLNSRATICFNHVVILELASLLSPSSTAPPLLIELRRAFVCSVIKLPTDESNCGTSGIFLVLLRIRVLLVREVFLHSGNQLTAFIRE
jgi:hypothetical protein